MRRVTDAAAVILGAAAAILAGFELAPVWAATCMVAAYVVFFGGREVERRRRR